MTEVTHPLVITKDVLAFVDYRCGMRCCLSEPRHRIGLSPPHAVGAEDFELVEVPGAHPFHEERPYASAGVLLHFVFFTVPVVEVPVLPFFFHVRCPHREACAKDGS